VISRPPTGPLSVLVVGDPFQYALEKLLPQFTESTGIRVKMETLSYDALNARLSSSFVGNTTPADVITVDQMWNGQYFDNKWIRPLDDLIKGDAELDLEDFLPEVLYSLNTWRGHIVTLPVAAYAQGVIYRKDVLGELGVSPPPKVPQESWTWQAYMDALGKVHGRRVRGKRLFGTVICGAQPVPIVHMYTQLAASNGVRWFKRFPQAPWDFTPTIDSPENVAALEMYRALYKLSPPEAINYVWFDAGTRFAQGDVGMFYWWTPYFYLVRNNGYMSGKRSVVADLYDVGALPASPNHPQVVSLGGWSLGIPANSRNQDAAWRFIKWAVSRETQRAMALVPDYNYQFSDFARRSLYSDEEVRRHYPYLDVQLRMMQLGNGKLVRPPVPIYPALEGVYGLQLNQALSGARSPQQALKTAQTLFTNLLQGNLLLPYRGPSYDDTLESTRQLIRSLAR